MEAVVVGIKQLWTTVHLLVVTEVSAVGPVLDHKPGHVVVDVAPALDGNCGHIHHLAEVKHLELVQVGVLGAQGSLLSQATIIVLQCIALDLDSLFLKLRMSVSHLSYHQDVPETLGVMINQGAVEQ